MISIDGSYLEGGGQIVRTALALSTITHKPFEVNNIRKGRCDSGLKPQHLFCVKALEELCNARIEGAKIGSERIKYKPNKIIGRTLSFDVGTAGSTTLLLQALLLPAMFGDKKVRIKLIGGSDVPWSQPVDYLRNVLFPHLYKYAKIDFSLLRRGYYPKGGGRIDLTVKPKYSLNNYDSFDSFWAELKKSAPKISLVSRGKLLYVKGISHASSELQKAEVAERQARAARMGLSRLGCPVKIDCEYSNSLCAGSGITLWAAFSEKGELDAINPHLLGADSLGEKGKRAEVVGTEAAKNLLTEISSKAPVDSYLADQLLPFMALVGSSKIFASKVTQHCRTNVYVIEKFLGKCFMIDEEKRLIGAG
jgi:RNA 3'-phosphate cyclase